MAGYTTRSGRTVKAPVPFTIVHDDEEERRVRDEERAWNKGEVHDEDNDYAAEIEEEDAEDSEDRAFLDNDPEPEPEVDPEEPVEQEEESEYETEDEESFDSDALESDDDDDGQDEESDEQDTEDPTETPAVETPTETPTPANAQVETPAPMETPTGETPTASPSHKRKDPPVDEDDDQFTEMQSNNYSGNEVYAEFLQDCINDLSGEETTFSQMVEFNSSDIFASYQRSAITFTIPAGWTPIADSLRVNRLVKSSEARDVGYYPYGL